MEKFTDYGGKMTKRARPKLALEMRRHGYTWEQVVKECGYKSVGSAVSGVRREEANQKKEDSFYEQKRILTVISR